MNKDTGYTDIKSWNYAAESPGGRVMRGSMAGPDAHNAEAALRHQGLIPISIRPATNSWFTGGRFAPSASLQGAALQDRDIANIAAQLHELLLAGIPVLAALRFAATCAPRPAQRAVLQELVGQVTAGKSVSSALRSASFNIPQFVVTLVEVGEATGDLGGQLRRISAHYESRVALERDLRGKLAYPAALLVLTIATVLFLSFGVLPQFEGIFTAAGAAPPPETALALGFGRGVREHWLAAGLGGLILFIVIRRFARHNPESFERAGLNAPWLGTLLRYREYSVYFRTLAAMLNGGAPLARAMPLSSQSVRLIGIRQELAAAEAEVRIGARLGAALQHKTSCPAELTALLAVGEETGELGKFAAHAAAHAQGVVDKSLSRMMALLSPALTIIMGLITAGVIASVLTGVLSLNDAI